MVDIHSHILPGMDDGSRSVEESCQMLHLLACQGVTHVAATPHFNANREPLAQFLDRRERAWDVLKNALPQDAPKILLGAEIRYYEGISRLPGLEKLTLGNSRLLLLEMPLDAWPERVVNELLYLSGSAQIVIAHVERSLKKQKRSAVDRLLSGGILLQSNASRFLQPLSRHKAIADLVNGRLHMLGSDCHNLTTRPPRLEEAMNVIEKKLGGEFLRQMDAFAHDLIKT